MWVHASLTRVYLPHSADMGEPEKQALPLGLLLQALGKKLWLGPPVKEGI